MDIVIASGKGGTGKTFIGTNLAVMMDRMGEEVTYLDCDVEEPDGHLFLVPKVLDEEEIGLISPVDVDPERCVSCGRCADACSYNAIAAIKDDVLFFPELCHVCGACTIVCPEDAIVEEEKKIGTLLEGRRGDIDVNYAVLETGEGGMAPRLIDIVKRGAGEGINIIDSPPGTACPAVESVKGADLVVLIADPTPFGVNDLKLSVNMCRTLGMEPVVLVNRAEYRDDSLKEYCEDAGLEIIGEIPDDRKIAETYSSGDLVVECLPEYEDLFKGLVEKLKVKAKEERELKAAETRGYEGEKVISSQLKQSRTDEIEGKPRELVVISGKGGTGKTSITGCFAALAEEPFICDCDVDAADLHLITDPEIKEHGLFSGGYQVEIDNERCTRCGRCYEECRFDAVRKEIDGEGRVRYEIDEFACEGCGVCDIVCDHNAIEMGDAINGEWFLSKTRFGPMSHAKLGLAEENSGRLVTLVRDKAIYEHSGENSEIIIDGAPGTGCPVIASLTGVDYGLVVTEPTVSGIHDMERVLDVADFFGVRTGILINKSDLNEDMNQKIRDIAEERGVEVLGEIPYDDVFTEAQMERLSVVEYSDGEISESIEEIWDKVVEEMMV